MSVQDEVRQNGLLDSTLYIIFYIIDIPFEYHSYKLLSLKNEPKRRFHKQYHLQCPTVNYTYTVYVYKDVVSNIKLCV